jgi:mono/diheme cytochrome c family protein
MNLHIRLAAFTALLIPACAPLEKAAPPVSTLNLPRGTNHKTLEEGRQLYATSCTHCHGPARIDKHGTDEKWAQKILPTMCEKAKLTSAQAEALTQYVLTARNSMAKAGTN